MKTKQSTNEVLSTENDTSHSGYARLAVVPFISTNQLDFESAPYPYQIDDLHNWIAFRIGTCEGLWCCTEKYYAILAVQNHKKGNGHFTDVLDWFKNSCKRDKKDLKILEVWNKNLKQHLISKKGFKAHSIYNVVWHYR